MKKIIELILVFLAIITTSCVTPSSTEVYDWSDDVTIPDNTGNLYIRNQTGENIVLYTYDENDILTIKKKISSDADLFLINVPNDDEIAKVLKIWLESKLDDPGSPDESKLYRQWDVVLASETTDETKRATWVITGG